MLELGNSKFYRYRFYVMLAKNNQDNGQKKGLA